MDDKILVSLNLEQASLIEKALDEFRKIYYERERMDNNQYTPRVQRDLNTIDQLKYYFKIEMDKRK